MKTEPENPKVEIPDWLEESIRDRAGIPAGRNNSYVTEESCRDLVLQALNWQPKPATFWRNNRALIEVLLDIAGKLGLEYQQSAEGIARAALEALKGQRVSPPAHDADLDVAWNVAARLEEAGDGHAAAMVRQLVNRIREDREALHEMEERASKAELQVLGLYTPLWEYGYDCQDFEAQAIVSNALRYEAAFCRAEKFLDDMRDRHQKRGDAAQPGQMADAWYAARDTVEECLQALRAALTGGTK